MKPLAALAVLALAAAPLAAPADWIIEQPVRVARTGDLRDRSTRESSALLPHRDAPHILWTISDSGNEPVLVAIDTTGSVLGTVRVTGAANEDWEALGRGPCPAGRCLYVGDIGDNRARRPHVVLYRLPEPDAAAYGSVAAESLRVRYPGGPRDAEAVVVSPAGDVLIVTKGIGSAVAAYRVAAAAWEGGGIHEAERLGPLPIDARTAFGRWVTDAAVAPDGRRVAIRTYRDIYAFELTATGELRPADPPALCDIAGVQVQGEGIAWMHDDRFVLTSEDGLSGAGAVHVVECAFARPSR